MFMSSVFFKGMIFKCQFCWNNPFSILYFILPIVEQLMNICDSIFTSNSTTQAEKITNFLTDNNSSFPLKKTYRSGIRSTVCPRNYQYARFMLLKKLFPKKNFLKNLVFCKTNYNKRRGEERSSQLKLLHFGYRNIWPWLEHLYEVYYFNYFAQR